MGIVWTCDVPNCRAIAAKTINYKGIDREVCEFHFVIMSTKKD